MNYEQDIKKRPPIHAVINITNQCNLRCDYCFVHPNPNYMSLSTGQDIVNWIVNNFYQLDEGQRDNPSISFFGGEPMLRYEEFIIPLLEWADSNVHLPEGYQISWGMTTNGTLLTKEVLRYLAMRKDFSILFSCDGDKNIQDIHRKTITGEGSFDKINKIIPDLLHYYPKVVFRSTITPDTVSYLYDSYLFARNQGFLNYFFMPNCKQEWPKEAIIELGYQMSNIGYTMYQDIINNRFVCNYTDLLRVIIHQIINPPNKPSKISFRSCGFGTSSVGISTNGLITGCQERNTFDENDIFYIGDIYKGINKEKHLKLLNDFIDVEPTRYNKNIKCENCILKDHCSSRICASTNYDATTCICQANNITCSWQILIYQIGKALCELAALDENQIFKNYLIEYDNSPEMI